MVPFIVVVPGMIAFAMFSQNMFGAQDAFTQKGVIDNDMAYPCVITSYSIHYTKLYDVYPVTFLN